MSSSSSSLPFFLETVSPWGWSSWVQQVCLSSKPWGFSCPCLSRPELQGQVTIPSCFKHLLGVQLKQGSVLWARYRLLSSSKYTNCLCSHSWLLAGRLVPFYRWRKWRGNPTSESSHGLSCQDGWHTLGIGFPLIKQMSTRLLSIICCWAETGGCPHTPLSVWY